MSTPLRSRTTCQSRRRRHGRPRQHLALLAGPLPCLQRATLSQLRCPIHIRTCWLPIQTTLCLSIWSSRPLQPCLSVLVIVSGATHPRYLVHTSAYAVKPSQLADWVTSCVSGI